MKIVGRWFDTFKFIDGTTSYGQHGEFDWGFNQIQNSFASLMAGWFRGESGFERLTYVGIGSGQTSWDSSPPSQPYSEVTLNNEVFRKALPQNDIYFIDPITNLPTGGAPSSKIEVVYTLGTTEANYDLREFGLFGGTATGAFDSGEMINWIVHSKISKDSSFEIYRRIRIQFPIQ